MDCKSLLTDCPSAVAQHPHSSLVIGKCRSPACVEMDAMQHQKSQVHFFQCRSRIYLHCRDVSNLFSFTVPSLPFLRINGLFAHYRFLESPLEKRMSILPLSERLLQKLEEYESPVVVNVLSSVIFEVCFYFCYLAVLFHYVLLTVLIHCTP